MHIQNIGSKSRAFINHKPFHPGNFKNVEAVWAKEEEKRKAAKYAKERAETRAEEAKIEALKGQLRQFEIGNTKNRSVHGLDWMYENPADAERRDGENAILLGKVEAKPAAKTAGDKLNKVDMSSPLEEGGEVTEDTLRKLREDPLYIIKLAAHQQREKLLANPYTRKQLLEKESKELEERLMKTEEGRLKLQLQSSILELKKEVMAREAEIIKLRQMVERKDTKNKRENIRSMSQSEKQAKLEAMKQAGSTRVTARRTAIDKAEALDRLEEERKKAGIIKSALR